jgi:CheY-like chemotaxis protein
VRGDPARLQQVIWNLLSNAVKFTPRGGRVEVRLARVGTQAELRVQDTGRGISAAFLPHLFQRFRQADSTPAREHGGLGLGLAIVKQLVELHGGQVRATSAGEDRGATFVVELPLALPVRTSTTELEPPVLAVPALTAGPPRARPVRLEGARILVVDDDADARYLLRKLLEECAAEVCEADSTRAALELLEHYRPDVLVSDIGMPVADGYELLAQARQRGLTCPAIALTAFARAEDRARAHLIGYERHIPKPVDASEFLTTVAELVQRPSARHDVA